MIRRALLIAGLLVVIPLATTIWLATTVSRFVLAFLTSIPKQLNPFNTLNPILQELINLGLGLVVPLLAILLIGLMARNIVGRWLLEFGEGTLQRIPVAGSVYKTLKQLLETFLRDNASRFRRVVLVEYPREGLYALGFVTGVFVRKQCSIPAQGLGIKAGARIETRQRFVFVVATGSVSQKRF